MQRDIANALDARMSVSECIFARLERIEISFETLADAHARTKK
ncbi:MAG: hypothetical protein Q8L78_04900 [Coxiellaceae bacterium]|nr:hypothetical protein [Coxiellaceae bacterium]